MSVADSITSSKQFEGDTDLRVSLGPVRGVQEQTGDDDDDDDDNHDDDDKDEDGVADVINKGAYDYEGGGGEDDNPIIFFTLELPLSSYSIQGSNDNKSSGFLPLFDFLKKLYI